MLSKRRKILVRAGFTLIERVPRKALGGVVY